MIFLSDAQAVTISGGSKRPGRSQKPSPAASPLSYVRERSVAQPTSYFNNNLNLLIAPLINLSIVVAANGGTAISGNQTNILDATLA